MVKCTTAPDARKPGNGATHAGDHSSSWWMCRLPDDNSAANCRHSGNRFLCLLGAIIDLLSGILFRLLIENAPVKDTPHIIFLHDPILWPQQEVRRSPCGSVRMSSTGRISSRNQNRSRSSVYERSKTRQDSIRIAAAWG